MPHKVKGKFYSTQYNMTLTKIGVAEMKILIWMFDHTRKDKIWNEYMWKWVEVVPISEKMV